MFPVIDLGPIAIQAPGLILIISFFLGTWLVGKFATALGTNGDAIENSLLIGLIAGILSARIGFFLQNPTLFIENPLSILSLTPTMLNPSFGILVGILSAFIFAQKKHFPLWPTLDTLTPLFLLIFIGIHLANFASGDAYGLPTSLPWGVQLWGALRHPVQLYALALSFALLVWLWFRTKGLTTNGYLQSGDLVLWTSAAISAITLFIRAFIAEKITLWQFDLIQLGVFILLGHLLGLIYNKSIKSQKLVHSILSLGSNQDAQQNLHKGLRLLSEQFNCHRTSSIYRTTDIRGQKKSEDFFNQVVEIATSKPYPELRERLKAIELKLGRQRGNKNQVPLDCDILTYGNEVFVYSSHQIPDPNLRKYRYIAEPLAEMAPEFRHPTDGKTIQEIIEQIPDQTQIIKLKEVENGSKR
jgi:2-amino-4-hydroxy-6-hydroxymethyldihydropteridine diphosphokinase